MNIDEFLLTVQMEIAVHLPEIIVLRSERKIKDDLSYVTNGDLLINKIITDIAYRKFTEVLLISEEIKIEESNPVQGYTVVIDPLDGTENFTSGLPEWGVSVACFHNGKHVGSLIGCPELNLWLKSGDSVQHFHSRIRGLSSSLSKDDLVAVLPGYEYRVIGCCVYNMMNVIRGSFLSFENPKGASNWDILGGLNLALENNLKVTVDDKPYFGEYLPADRKYRFCVENR